MVDLPQAPCAAADGVGAAAASAALVQVPPAVLALLERTTSDLIVLPSAALDELIDRTLADIGRLFRVDRAYLFLASEDQTTYDNTHEWCAPGIEPQRENLQGLPVGMFPWWTEEMRQGRPIVLGSLDDLPPEGVLERALLEPQGIQSLLALPMIWRGRFWGMTGFDHVQRRHAWSPDEITVLRLVASAFAQGFERRRLDARLGLASTVFEHAREGIFVTDREHRVLDVNPTFGSIVDIDAASAVGRLQDDLLPGLHRTDVRRALHEAGLWRGEFEHTRADGRRLALHITLSAVRDGAGEVSGTVGVFSDVTQLREQAQRLRELAYHDPLTQLPNRALLADRMRQALAQARRTGDTLAVGLLDLDSFKPVNDDHGHVVGDQVLVEVARRLGAALREGDTVARLGGDEFVLLLPGLSSGDEGLALMQRVLSEVRRPIEIDGRIWLRLSASIGLRSVPPVPEDADTLLREADHALYIAKREGRARIHCFDADDARVSLQRQARIAEIEQALQAGQMQLHYQPVVDLRSGRAVRVEALVRWARPGGALVLPGEWLPLIEQSSLILQLGQWVLGTALRDCAAWQARAPGLGVSVNISARELCDPGQSRRVAAALAGVPALTAGLLQLEVVESAPMSAMPAALTTMRECMAQGVRFALDDFGTGYSSLAYLKTLPVAAVKIDRSFVGGLGADRADAGTASGQRILKGIVDLIAGYGLEAVTEGIETDAQAAELLAAGCTLGQGYGLLPPVELGALLDWLRRPTEPTSQRCQTRQSARAAGAPAR